MKLQMPRKGWIRINRDSDVYMTRLIKLIPADVVILYQSYQETASSWLGLLGWVCLILVFVLRWHGVGSSQESQDKKTQWNAIFVSCFSFVLWIYAIGGYLSGFNVTPPAGLFPFLIAVWTVVAPLIVSGD